MPQRERSHRSSFLDRKKNRKKTTSLAGNVSEMKLNEAKAKTKAKGVAGHKGYALMLFAFVHASGVPLFECVCVSVCVWQQYALRSASGYVAYFSIRVARGFVEFSTIF